MHLGEHLRTPPAAFACFPGFEPVARYSTDFMACMCEALTLRVLRQPSDQQRPRQVGFEWALGCRLAYTCAGCGAPHIPNVPIRASAAASCRCACARACVHMHACGGSRAAGAATRANVEVPRDDNCRFGSDFPNVGLGQGVYLGTPLCVCGCAAGKGGARAHAHQLGHGGGGAEKRRGLSLPHIQAWDDVEDVFA